MRIKTILSSLLLLLAVESSTAQPTDDSVHLTMGNPSRATTDPNNSDNFLIVKPQYTLSYNNSKKIPNWVSWQLNKNWLGNERRCGNFKPDPALPSSFRRALPTEYTRSGFTRGHMTPSGDRTNNRQNNCATFLMTNIIPQTPDNNAGPWEKLESHCRNLVSQGKELYIISGGSGEQRTIAVDKISVPEKTWKVVVVLDRPGLGLGGVIQNTEIIAVDMPNQQGIKEDSWQEYRTTVDEIEMATGYDLLSNIPKTTQDVIEAR